MFTSIYRCHSAAVRIRMLRQRCNAVSVYIAASNAQSELHKKTIKQNLKKNFDKFCCKPQ